MQETPVKERKKQAHKKRICHLYLFIGGWIESEKKWRLCEDDLPRIYMPPNDLGEHDHKDCIPCTLCREIKKELLARWR